MAEKKAQTMVRADPDDLARWKDAATIRGVSLNQWMVDGANRAATANMTESFVSTGGVATAPFDGKVTLTANDPLLAFDLALNETPTLTGVRKWVDPQALREAFAFFVTKPEGE